MPPTDRKEAHRHLKQWQNLTPASVLDATQLGDDNVWVATDLGPGVLGPPCHAALVHIGLGLAGDSERPMVI